MNPGLGIGLAVGVTVGNMFIYRFLFDKPWFDAIGIGLTAGIIAFVLYWIASKVM